jgi:hypothetical protein
MADGIIRVVESKCAKFQLSFKCASHVYYYDVRFGYIFICL